MPIADRASDSRIVGRAGEHGSRRLRVRQGLGDRRGAQSRREPQGDRRDVSAPSLVLLGEALILSAHHLLAIRSFEAANDKVAPRDVLEMLDERVVHGSAAECTEEWNRLRRKLLRDHESKARRDLSDKANENWSTLLDNAALDDISGGL